MWITSGPKKKKNRAFGQPKVVIQSSYVYFLPDGGVNKVISNMHLDICCDDMVTSFHALV